MIGINNVSVPEYCGEDCIFCRFNYDIDMWECSQLLRLNEESDIKLSKDIVLEGLAECIENKFIHQDCPIIEIVLIDEEKNKK